MEAIDALKQKVLSLAIQGKLVAQDPNDEPASVLLEKIKAEKAELVKQGKIKKDKQESYIFRGDDNKYYEKIGSETKDITEEIPFDIPNNWEWVRLKTLGLTQTGTTPSKNESSFWGGDFPFIHPAEISNNKISRAKEFLSFKGVEKARYIEKNSILMICIGDIGRAAITEIPCSCNQQINSLTTYNALDAKYILFSMLSDCFQLQAKEKASQTLVAILNKDKWEKLIIPLPPLSEQKRIVEEIEKIFGQIEVVKENQEELNKLKDGLKNKVLDLAIQGKLVEQDPNDEPASVLLERIKAEKAELVKQGKIKKDKQESYIYKGTDNRHYEKIGSEVRDITEEIPFDIPNNWEWVRLGNVINLTSGRDLTPDCYSDIETKNCVPYITGASNIENEQVIINRWTSKPQTLAYKGDLLLTCKGTVGLIAFLQCENAHIARQIMSLKSFTCIDMLYLKYFVLSYMAELQRRAKSMIPGISRDDVLQTLCPMPPLKEQQRIAKKIEIILNTIDDL